MTVVLTVMLTVVLAVVLVVVLVVVVSLSLVPPHRGSQKRELRWGTYPIGTSQEACLPHCRRRWREVDRDRRDASRTR